MDSNKNGSLDRSEVSSALRSMGIPGGRGVGSAFMKAVDKNKDDKIDFEEFIAYAKERREKVREVFDDHPSHSQNCYPSHSQTCYPHTRKPDV